LMELHVLGEGPGGKQSMAASDTSTPDSGCPVAGLPGAPMKKARLVPHLE
jgi:hypothetical protein